MSAVDSNAFDGLDEQYLRYYSPDYGFVDTASLSVYYDFDLPPASPRDAVELAKTTAHEIAHFYQIATTSYGFYIQQLRQFQNTLVLNMIRELTSKYGLKVTFPIAQSLMRLRPRKHYADILHLLRLWLLVDCLISWFEGSGPSVAAKLWDNPLTRHRTFLDLMTDIEHPFANYLIHMGLLNDYSPWWPTFDEKSAEEARFFALKRYGGLWTADVRSLLEGAAAASEYWGAGPEALTAIKHDRSYDFYGSWLIQVSEDNPQLSTKELILSLLALADLALNLPVLPQQYTTRPANLTALSLNPAWRMEKGVQALKEVRPMQDVTDYSRFAGEICHANEWPEHREVLAAANTSMGDPQKDVIPGAWLFKKALWVRSRWPFAFLHWSIWSSDPPDELLSYYFVHPLIEFRNKRIEHPDSSFAFSYASNFVSQRYLRGLFLTGQRDVVLPFNPSKKDRRALQEAHNTVLSDLHIPLPPVVILKGRRTARDH